MHPASVTNSFSTGDSGFALLQQDRSSDPRQPDRAQRLSMRYDHLKARLLALNAAPHKNMAAIDGVIGLLAHTEKAMRLLHGHRAR